MSKTTVREKTITKLDEYIVLRKAESALYEAAEATNYEHKLLTNLVDDIGGLACDAALDAFCLAARSRDVNTIHTVVRTLRNYGNDWLFDELAEDLFGEDEAA